MPTENSRAILRRVAQDQHGNLIAPKLSNAVEMDLYMDENTGILYGVKESSVNITNKVTCICEYVGPTGKHCTIKDGKIVEVEN